MRAEDLALALGGLDESFIAPAAADMLRDEKRRAPRVLKLIAIAAAAVTVAVLLLLAGLSVGKPRTPVSHPEATVRTEPGEPGGSSGGRPDLPVVKPGASPEKSTGTETETDPVATEPDTTTAPEATEPEYTEPEPTEPEPTEPAYYETDPPEEPEVIDGISDDEFYVMMYRALGGASRPPEEPPAAEPPEEPQPKDPGTQGVDSETDESGEPADSTPGSVPGSVVETVIPCGEPTPASPATGGTGDNPAAAKQWYLRTFSEIESGGTGQSSGGEVTPLPMTKAQLAVRLYNAAHNIGVILPAVREWAWFDDFADGQWYSDAVFEAYRAGVIDAVSAHHMGTDEPISASEAEAAAAKFAAIMLESGALVAGN
ncbi:MAG: hypothetical protein IKI91_02520 [Clostridia bacterium]|nr:hypothetical protein [Clostridia bacterium]